MAPERRGSMAGIWEQDSSPKKLGTVAGVYIPVVLSIISILMFLRFGSIIGQIGLLGILALLVVAYFVDLVTALSLSAIASNGEVKGGGAYYLISRSLGPEFGGSIGVLFYLSQVLNTALNVVGLIDCLKLNLADVIPGGYWNGYLMETCALLFCTCLCLAGSGIFARASNGLLAVLVVSTLSIPFSAVARSPFEDSSGGVEFTGLSLETLRSNLYPHSSGPHYHGFDTFRALFGILFPATSGIFAGASMSGDLRNPSKAIPKGTLWAMLSTFTMYLLVIISMASSITHSSFLQHTNVVSETNIWPPLILAGECATTVFSILMGVIGAAKLLQALARDKLLPALSIFGQGTNTGDEPVYAILVTFGLAQIALFADLNQIATFISMGYQMTFFVMNLACFLLKIGSAPNFRPAFTFFSWQTAFVGSVMSAAAMFFIDETVAAAAICVLVFLFLLIHYLSPPKHWGDVSQNLIYHQVRKYLLRLRPEHIKFWRPQIILLVNDPRHHTRLIQFCNSLKKGSLYILGHVIVTEDFNSGIYEAKLQQSAWTRYISEFSKIKAFVQLTMSPSIEWGARNLILSAGLGGMRPNIAVIGFYNMDELRKSRPFLNIPEVLMSPREDKMPSKSEERAVRRRRGDSSARLLDGILPTDEIRTEGMMSATNYMTILEDLALRHRLNVAVGKGFQTLETPRADGANAKKYIDLWPIQMSAEITSQGKSVLTTNFDTYTLILQLGYILRSVPAWKKAFQLRVLVFVEYETEVEQERARLGALLDKLRIDAEIQVFFLASGDVGSYESIVNGRAKHDDMEWVINELLKHDEWWLELQRIRHDAQQAARSQELASLGEMLEATKRRGSSPRPTGRDAESRRLELQELLELPKSATVSKMARLGMNFGIHTNYLDSTIIRDQSAGRGFDSSEDEYDSSGSDTDFNDAASAVSEGDADEISSLRQSLLPMSRRNSSGDVLGRRDSRKAGKARVPLLGQNSAASTPGYGSTDMGATGHPPNLRPTISPINYSNPDLAIHPMTMSAPNLAMAGSRSSSTAAQARAPVYRNKSSNKFSSRTMPGTSVIEEDPVPAITPEPTERVVSTPKSERPPLSRHSSAGQRRFSSRPVPETRIENEDDSGPRLMFAEPRVQASSPLPSTARNNLNIPELLDSYRLGTGQGADVRSDYSAQSLPLSFNDLPSRAQHLILNELMRQHSGETAVLLTTLPIPEEGICKSEEESLRYLSDIEVLSHDLPPLLLVLSNNMTVTVSL